MESENRDYTLRNTVEVRLRVPLFKGRYTFTIEDIEVYEATIVAIGKSISGGNSIVVILSTASLDILASKEVLINVRHITFISSTRVEVSDGITTMWLIFNGDVINIITEEGMSDKDVIIKELMVNMIECRRELKSIYRDGLITTTMTRLSGLITRLKGDINSVNIPGESTHDEAALTNKFDSLVTKGWIVLPKLQDDIRIEKLLIDDDKKWELVRTFHNKFASYKFDYDHMLHTGNIGIIVGIHPTTKTVMSTIVMVDLTTLEVLSYINVDWVVSKCTVDTDKRGYFTAWSETDGHEYFRVIRLVKSDGKLTFDIY